MKMNDFIKDLERASIVLKNDELENFKKALDIAEEHFAKLQKMFSAYSTPTHWLFLSFNRYVTYDNGFGDIKIDKQTYKVEPFNLPNEENFNLLEQKTKIFGKVEKEDLIGIIDMPNECDHFELKNDLTMNEQDNLIYGFTAFSTEDRWQYYGTIVNKRQENNKLFLYRSWGGHCIFIVEFADKKLKVTVNRNKKQYNHDNIIEDKELLHRLLHIFGRTIYNEVLW